MIGGRVWGKVAATCKKGNWVQWTGLIISKRMSLAHFGEHTGVLLKRKGRFLRFEAAGLDATPGGKDSFC